MRALISTYDKNGLDVFARGLAELGWQLVASGGTGRDHAGPLQKLQSAAFSECLPRQIIAKQAKNSKCAAIMIVFRPNPFVV